MKGSPFFGVPENPPKSVPGISPEDAAVIEAMMRERELAPLGLAPGGIDLSSAPSGAVMYSAPEPSLRERAGNAVYDLTKAFGFPSTAQQYRKVVTGGVDFLPGVGDAVGFEDAARDYSSGNYGDAAVGGVASVFGLLPGAGDLAAKGIRLGGKKILRHVENRDALQNARSSGKGGPEFTDDQVGYDLPPEQQMSIEDYYGGSIPETDNNGMLLFDPEGRPLVAPPERITGRTDLGDDLPIPPNLLTSVVEELTGRPIRRAPTGDKDLAGALGTTRFDQTGAPIAVTVDERLKGNHAGIVEAHETGHVVETIANLIPTDGIEDELGVLYHRLVEGRKPSPGEKPLGPTDVDYPKAQERMEYIAEAIRSYLRTPNEFKINFPKTAKRIRDYVNANEDLKHSIQFNSLLGTAGAGTVLLSDEGSQSND